MSLTDEQRAQSIANCPESNWHESGPFRYCACGWTEEPATPVLTDAEKLDYVYNIAVKAEKLMEEIAPQIGPMLQSIQNNPMLKMFMR